MLFQNGSNRLVEWREGKELYESVTFYEDGKKKRLPVCPDAFFYTEQNGRRMAYALEADRDTTTRRTFGDKLKAYWRFLEQKRQTKAFGVDWFRIVTMTLTQARTYSLTEMASLTLPNRLNKFFLFVSRENFSHGCHKAVSRKGWSGVIEEA